MRPPTDRRNPPIRKNQALPFIILISYLWGRLRGHEGTSHRNGDEGNADLPEVAHNASPSPPLSKGDGGKSKDRVELETREIINRKPITQVQHSPAEIEATAEHIAELEANHEPPPHELPTSPDLDWQQRLVL